MKFLILELKTAQKLRVQLIRETKEAYKAAQRSGVSIWPALSAYQKAQYEFRHHHIAHCLVRGTPRAHIESVKRLCQSEKPCYCCNRPKEDYIESIVRDVSHKIAEAASHETLCARAG